MTTGAQLVQLAPSAGQSRAERRRLRLETEGATASGETTPVILHNISATGLLLECPLDLAVGEEFAIDLPSAGATTARIMWASGNFYGCQFGDVISSATLGAARLKSDDPDQPGPAESFGSRLRQLRKLRGLTLDQVAARLDVSKPTVWAWEQGRARPTNERIAPLCEVLGVDEETLAPQQAGHAVQGAIARCREEIGALLGLAPARIRILVEF